MRILSIVALLFLLLVSGLTIRDQHAQQLGPSDEVSQLKKQVANLEDRIVRLEKRLDRMAQPRMVPLTSVGPTKEMP